VTVAVLAANFKGAILASDARRLIAHDGRGFLTGLPQGFAATRYHSLIVDEGTLPACLTVTARTDGCVPMGVRHSTQPTEGVQFHPESILTLAGKQLLGNFLRRLPARAA